MKVFVLVTVRTNPPAPGSVMVFDSIRKGFPTSSIHLQLNSVLPEAYDAILNKVERLDSAILFRLEPTIHHDWIRSLIESESDPFWICDTDVMFWDSVEEWRPKEAAIMGRRIPQFFDEFTGAITRARLHPSLMYIDPLLLKQKVVEWRRQFTDTPFNPLADVINPLMVAWKEKAYFYDTMSMLYNAIGGQPFTDDQLDCYDHMNFGTIEDLVLPLLKDGVFMRGLRQSIYKNPIKGRGMWRIQEQYYQARQA